MDDKSRSVVLRERRKRGWSVRRAAGAGHISNTTWGRYESGDLELSGAIRNAIAVAFGWPPDWPEREVPDWDAAVSDATVKVTAALERIEARIEGEVSSQLAEHHGRLLDVETRLQEQAGLLRDLAKNRRRRSGPGSGSAALPALPE
jgi:transcriptional regulator with XRE-family HTH domain